MARPAPRVGFLEAKTQKLRCTCGHARSTHRQASHRPYELGACTGTIDTPIGDSACPCHEYDPQPARLPGGAT